MKTDTLQALQIYLGMLAAVTSPVWIYILAKSATLGILRGRQLFADRQKQKQTNP